MFFFHTEKETNELQVVQLFLLQQGFCSFLNLANFIYRSFCAPWSERNGQCGISYTSVGTLCYKPDIHKPNSIYLHHWSCRNSDQYCQFQRQDSLFQPPNTSLCFLQACCLGIGWQLKVRLAWPKFSIFSLVIPVCYEYCVTCWRLLVSFSLPTSDSNYAITDPHSVYRAQTISTDSETFLEAILCVNKQVEEERINPSNC